MVCRVGVQVGFCAAVLEPTAGVTRGPGGGGGRESLLEAIFAVYAQLWDEALGVSAWGGGVPPFCG